MNFRAIAIFAVLPVTAQAAQCPLDRATYVAAKGNQSLKVEAVAHEEICGNTVKWLSEPSPKACNTGLYIKGQYVHDGSRNEVIYADTSVYRAYGTNRIFGSDDPLFTGKSIQWKKSNVMLPDWINPIDGVAANGGEWKLVCK